MTRVRINLDAELTDEMLSAFPQLTTVAKRTQTVVTGDVVDQQELQGVLNHLSLMGITIIDVITIPDQDAS